MSIHRPRTAPRASASAATPSNACRQRGLGLLEVLVALVVVSFGVLGMAGLQLTGMKHSAGGFNRAKALLMAEDMATRMRINTPSPGPGGGWTYDDFDSGADPAAYCAARPPAYCQASGGANAASCDAAELATFDLFTVACGDWGDGEASAPIDRVLPLGRLRVDCAEPCLADSTWTIAVEWQEGSTTADEPEDADEAVDTRSVRVRLRP